MVQDTRSEARQGIAAAIAMSAAMPSAAGRVSWTVNTGMFKNETAIGGSVAYRLGTWMPLAVNAGYAVSGSDTHAFRAGASGEF